VETAESRTANADFERPYRIDWYFHGPEWHGRVDNVMYGPCRRRPYDNHADGVVVVVVVVILVVVAVLGLCFLGYGTSPIHLGLSWQWLATYPN
jgi:hypothetical protein